MGVSKTSNPIDIKMKVPNPSQKTSASSKAPNEDLKDLDVLCTFKSRERAKIWIMGISKTSDHIQIKILYPSQEPPVSSKAQNEDLKDMDVLHLQNQDR